MTGISVQIALREAEARDTLRGLLARLDDRRPFFKGVASLLEGSVSDRFRTQTDPDGTPWALHALSTVRARTRAGHLPLTILKGNRKGVSGSSLPGTLSTRFGGADARIGLPLRQPIDHLINAACAVAGTDQALAPTLGLQQRHGFVRKIVDNPLLCQPGAVNLPGLLFTQGLNLARPADRRSLCSRPLTSGHSDSGSC